MYNHPTDEEIQILMELYDGFHSHIGQTRIGEMSNVGKLEAKCYTTQKQPSFALWKNHLLGIGPGLGIVPLKEDNTVSWSAIDIDCYPFDHSAIEAEIRRKDLPLYTFVSKSCGAHLTAFFQSPVEAEKAVAFMKHCHQVLGLDPCEIFPKQTKRNRPNEIGNWLNMPYYGGMKHGRYAFLNGKPATLTEFLKEIKNEN